MTRTAYLLIAACILLGLTACVSKPEVVSVGPYWMDAAWEKALVESVHDKVLYPNGAAAFFILHSEATVAFSYKDGKLVNPELVKSTGYNFLDKIIIAEIQNVDPPPVDPAYTKVEHRFQLSIVLEPDPDQLRNILYSKIASGTKLATTQYPASRTVIDIHTDYIDGKLTNIELHLVRGSVGIERQLETALESLPLPSPPDYMAHKPVPLAITVCVAQTYKACKPTSLVAWSSLHGLTFAIVPP